MATTVSDFLIKRISEGWNVRRVFGYPGDGINGLMGALNRASDVENRVEFIQARHEEEAAFMACAHAKFTGEVGVCIATSGPGAIHLLNGLYDAKLDHQPVVAIVGQQARIALGGSFQQEVDLISLFKDVAGEYVQMATVPEQIKHLVDRAFRIARSERTVTCIIIPTDLQEVKYAEQDRVHGAVFSSSAYSTPIIKPSAGDLQTAADILNAGSKVAILVGAGAAAAGLQVAEVADILGAGVAKALLGKDVLPDELPYVTGAIGLLGTKPSWDLMSDCDTLLIIGSSFPYSEFLPRPGTARGVQIDIDAKMLGIRYPMEMNLHGDSRTTLQALIPLLQRKEDRAWREKIEKSIREWWQVLEARSNISADPINPQKVLWELSSRLPDDCIISADSGSIAFWYARDIKIRAGMKGSLSGNLATMCPGVPYAIAAKFAFPERMPIALVGDGAMQMLGINGLITIAKYYHRWQDARLMVLVLNNRDLNMVTWEQRIMNGDPKYDASQDIPDFPYAEYARMIGLEGIAIRTPDEIPEALDAAFRMSKPVVVDVLTDPSVPPLPPHIIFEQAKNFGSFMFKEDSDFWDVIKQTWKNMIQEYIPDREKNAGESR